MYLISFYVPADDVEQVKQAMFASGAGKIGQYSSCAWQTLGEGQFMPLEGANPTIGSKFQVEKVSEFKVEVVCADEHIKEVVAALKKSHPYEAPAFQVMRVEDF